MVEPAAEQGAMLQLLDESVDRVIRAGEGAVDALRRQQDAALEFEASAACAQGHAQLPVIRKPGELVEGSDFQRHGGGLSGTSARRNPSFVVPTLSRDPF